VHNLSDVSLDVFEPPNAWDLFRKDAMQLAINPMSLDRNPNEFARSDLNRRAAQGAPCHLENLLGMAVNNRCHHHLLAREVRVQQRTDADPRHLANPVGARPVILADSSEAGLWHQEARNLRARTKDAFLEVAILGVVAGDHVRGRAYQGRRTRGL
jgi:hypothetical protein